MSLIRKSFSQQPWSFLLDYDFEERSIWFNAVNSRDTSPGLHYWFIQNNPDPVPCIEFLFGNSGVFFEITVYLRSDSISRKAPASLFQLPVAFSSLPSVSLKPWVDEGCNVVKESTRVFTWLNGNLLWIMRANTQPHSCFDTQSGIYIIFDEKNSFSGAAVKIQCDRAVIESALQIKDIKNS